jgi:hypothetical protein
MPNPLPERVVFEFADRELVGDVIDTTRTAAFNHPPETIYTVEAGDSRYTVPARNATPA